MTSCLVSSFFIQENCLIEVLYLVNFSFSIQCFDWNIKEYLVFSCFLISCYVGLSIFISIMPVVFIFIFEVRLIMFLHDFCDTVTILCFHTIYSFILKILSILFFFIIFVGSPNITILMILHLFSFCWLWNLLYIEGLNFVIYLHFLMIFIMIHFISFFLFLIIMHCFLNTIHPNILKMLFYICFDCSSIFFRGNILLRNLLDF